MDVIAVLCKLVIKVGFLFSIHLSGLTLIQHQIQASGACVEYFNELQIQCGIGILMSGGALSVKTRSWSSVTHSPDGVSLVKFWLSCIKLFA
jgi:primosomal replication protein N